MRFDVQQQGTGENLTGEQRQGSLLNSNRKAPGTRIGVLIDWREGSTKSGRVSGRYGHALRDGR